MSNSIGDLKNTGLKGNNWPWQYKMLKGLEGIIDIIASTANGSEYEAKVVNIECPGDPGDPFTGTRIYLEVRTWNTVTGGFTDILYYEPGDIANPLTPADVANCTVTYAESQVPYTLGQTTMSQSVPVTLANDQTGIVVTPNIITSVGDAATAIAVAVYAITFFNNGSVPVQVSFDAGVSFSTIPAGVSISMDAGSINNTYAANTFEYDTSTLDPAGSLIITYNS